jgi:hypothetical protein
MGYIQYLENLTYYVIIGFVNGTPFWQQLVDTINIASKTYNITIKDIYEDYERLLLLKLRNLANVV